MTYTDREISIQDGQPFFLYLFADGLTAHRLNSDPEELVVDGETWGPSPISHTHMEMSGNLEKQILSLTFPLSNILAQSFLVPSGRTTTVTVFRGHHNDLDEELRVVWKGRVVGATSQKQSIEVQVENIFTSMRRSGCRARYQINCRHTLYLPGCNLNLNDFKIAAIIADISGVVLTVSAAASYPDQHFRAGMVIWNGLFGFIINHIGNQLTLMAEIPTLFNAFEILGPIDIFIAPGCDLSLATCDVKFANSLNHGGFPWLPPTNPFSSSIV